ncbi:MAG: hypothetical protein QG618_1553, partial [Thermodesulfobacteriota bacterium]|nr:hypothetical protein [Thermodesulfobacteriota bacterium]
IKHYDTLKDVRKMFPNGKFTCNKNNLNCWITDSSIDGKIFVKFFRKKQLPLIGFIAWFPSEPIFVKTVRLWYHSSGESYIDPDMGSSLVWRNMGCKEDVQAVLSDDDKYIKYFIYVPSGHLKLP